MAKSTLRHRDASGRVIVVDSKDAGRERYLRPSDGRLAPLIVQAADENSTALSSKGWTGSGKMRMQISPILDLVHWTYSSVFEEGSEERDYSGSNTAVLLLKWIPSCILLVLMLLIPQDLEGNQRNNGFYDPIRYRDWGYSKASRNVAENRSNEEDEADEPQENAPLLPDDIEMSPLSHPVQSLNNSTTAEQELDEDFDDLPARQFRPRYLCFITHDSHHGYRSETHKVTDWIAEHGDAASTDFIFLSYTRKQFCVGTPEEIATWTLPDAETRAAYTTLAAQDRATLVHYGTQAALAAGVSAFWLDFECIRDADNTAKAHSQSADVYRICDIVRAAHSLVILLGPPLPSRLPHASGPQPYSPAASSLWLREWGTRLWTLPEILLSSPEHRVRVLAVGGGPRPPAPQVEEALPKRAFAARGAWRDAKLVRQLVDHYEGSVRLTPLELVAIALECFAARTTDAFSPGDVAYALMGLLRRRPAVVPGDSAFEAFARLSLANDSDALLERLLCMLPARRDAPWHEMRDAWGARLWDIEPRCQVAGIVDDGAVVLDGAVGASVQWESVDQVAFFKRPTLARTFGKILLRGVPAYLIFGLVMTIMGGVFLQNYHDQKESYDDDDSSYADEPSEATKTQGLALLIPGLIFLVPSAIITLLAPVMLLDIYRGKFWSTQALFIGVQGMVDIGEAERHLFGFNHGRLKWSTNGSTLSRHRYVDGECVALPPALEKDPKKTRGLTLFTLIDTYAMTATCFYAERPPVTVIVCGQEGGMQRAVLCSYDWRTQTFSRETVIRVKTLVLDRMFRVDRFRFALKRRRHSEDTHEDGEPTEYSTLVDDRPKTEEQHEIWPTWKIDLLILPFMWYIFGLPPSAPVEQFDYLGPYGIASYAGFFMALIPGMHLMHRLQIGHIISLAIVFWSSLNIGATFAPTKLGGGIGLGLFMGAASGIIYPAFVVLTGAWYTAREQTLRILIWGFSSLFYDDAYSEISYAIQESVSGSLGDQIEVVVISVIAILLAGLAYFFVRTPEQARWISAQERSRLSNRHANWKSTTWSNTQAMKLLRDPQLWIFLGMSLLNEAFIATKRIQPSFQEEHAPWVVDMPCIILVLVLGLIMMRFPNNRIPIMCLAITLEFAARLTYCLHVVDYKENTSGNLVAISLAKGLRFMIQFGGITRYLIWALALANTHDITSRLTTICATFSGFAAGGIIGSIYWTAVLAGKDSQASLIGATPMHGYIAFISTLYGLQVLVLAMWYLYYFKINRSLPYKRGYDGASVATSDASATSGILGDRRSARNGGSVRFFT